MAQACSEDDLSGGKTYSIVLFEDEDEVSVVPTSWISENTVRWPPFKSTAKITTAIKEQQPPSSDWTSYRCRVLWTCAMLGKLLKEVKGIRAQVDGLEKSIQRIEQAITENKQPCAQPVSSAILELLPLATHQRLEELQWQLHDEKNRTDLMAHLSRIGGTSVQDSVRKIMRRCMCDTLAQDFSLTGRKGKRPFIGLYLLQVLTETLKSNFAQATESQIHLSIAEWLRYAPSRQKKRDAASPLMS
ncbi:uncharacterized protein [Dermacentor albipictus]|uniref:uncharacterized protein isoform X2 n=1 Tax=Dermacentor albipictus TaxID=60249 RepID=UPI0038FC0F90